MIADSPVPAIYSNLMNLGTGSTLNGARTSYYVADITNAQAHVCMAN